MEPCSRMERCENDVEKHFVALMNAVIKKADCITLLMHMYFAWKCL